MWDSRQWEQGCPWCCDWLLGTHSSCWIVLPRLNTGGGAWSYGDLTCQAVLKHMEGRPLSDRVGVGREGRARMGGEDGGEAEVGM